MSLSWGEFWNYHTTTWVGTSDYEDKWKENWDRDGDDILTKEEYNYGINNKMSQLKK